ncbi:hypothetical protein YC2023_031768 [Brassica napus]
MLSDLSDITVYERKKLGEKNIEFPEDILHSSFLTYKLDLSFNNILGVLPKTLANISQLDTLDLRNNSLSAFVLPACSSFDDANIEVKQPQGETNTDKSTLHNMSDSAYLKQHCNQVALIS